MIHVEGYAALLSDSEHNNTLYAKHGLLQAVENVSVYVRELLYCNRLVVWCVVYTDLALYDTHIHGITKLSYTMVRQPYPHKGALNRPPTLRAILAAKPPMVTYWILEEYTTVYTGARNCGRQTTY